MDDVYMGTRSSSKKWLIAIFVVLGIIGVSFAVMRGGRQKSALTSLEPSVISENSPEVSPADSGMGENGSAADGQLSNSTEVSDIENDLNKIDFNQSSDAELNGMQGELQ